MFRQKLFLRASFTHRWLINCKRTLEWIKDYAVLKISCVRIQHSCEDTLLDSSQLNIPHAISNMITESSNCCMELITMTISKIDIRGGT